MLIGMVGFRLGIWSWREGVNLRERVMCQMWKSSTNCTRTREPTESERSSSKQATKFGLANIHTLVVQSTNCVNRNKFSLIRRSDFICERSDNCYIYSMWTLRKCIKSCYILLRDIRCGLESKTFGAVYLYGQGRRNSGSKRGSLHGLCRLILCSGTPKTHWNRLKRSSSSMGWVCSPTQLANNLGWLWENVHFKEKKNTMEQK